MQLRLLLLLLLVLALGNETSHGADVRTAHRFSASLYQLLARLKTSSHRSERIELN